MYQIDHELRFIPTYTCNRYFKLYHATIPLLLPILNDSEGLAQRLGTYSSNNSELNFMLIIIRSTWSLSITLLTDCVKFTNT